MFDLFSTEVRTSWWWTFSALGFLYFLRLAVRRYIVVGRDRARLSIVAFALSWMVLSMTAPALRWDPNLIHAKVIEVRTFLAMASLWWMIYEFRQGNITLRQDVTE